MSNIPTDIKNIINSTVFAPWYTDEGNIIFRKGAEFGYSLAIERVKELEKEVERLKGLIDVGFKRAYDLSRQAVEIDGGYYREQCLAAFKTENNL